MYLPIFRHRLSQIKHLRTKMSNTREIAVLILHRILEEHTLPDSQDDEQPFVKMLILTVCRNAVSLSQIINSFLKNKIPHKHILTKTILTTATAELLFMASPDYAVINSYVEISKKKCGKALSGLVNAILHNISRQKAEIINHYKPQFFPDSFRKILQQDYTSEQIDLIEQASLSQPPLNLTIKKSSSEWAAKLQGTKVNQQTISLISEGKISSLEGYSSGEWWVQDIAAALAVPQFSALKGKRILDLCAAPGGKTAQLINNGAIVTSLDCSEQRLKTLEENLTRLKLQPEKIICDDVLNYLEHFADEPFDGILLDAPCSATGIFRRHPEIVYLKSITDVKKQALLQHKILEKISPALKSGGELIYCTCSIAKAEGEDQITEFIKTHSDFRIVPLNNTDEPLSITPEGFIRTLPYHYNTSGGCDAFFIAKLRKD